MVQFFKGLFEYNHHFNQQLATVFNELPSQTSEKSVKLYNHVLNAHQVWNSRIRKDQKVFGVWDIHPIADLKEIDHTNLINSMRILDESDLGHTISYINSRGDAYTSSVRDILFHVINHSTYHRGQIAMEFKQQGIAPLITDYIFYKR